MPKQTYYERKKPKALKLSVFFDASLMEKFKNLH